MPDFEHLHKGVNGPSASPTPKPQDASRPTHPLPPTHPNKQTHLPQHAHHGVPLHPHPPHQQAGAQIARRPGHKRGVVVRDKHESQPIQNLCGRGRSLARQSHKVAEMRVEKRIRVEVVDAVFEGGQRVRGGQGGEERGVCARGVVRVC